ncbi:hypothetical protein CLV98_107101 [Dyadobacter jejuensis]|uniref:Uncharacterized protein n=1 Tax=Dyadobacter jejuensis TaxID=1082580 RepID=A0A316AK61_9BACT|nr:hypothetical protein [Dyadobacter jejuensis]PWJ57394.1 hypothetical protein CLV98_107101 [Dyadobacter jejuensis]
MKNTNNITRRSLIALRILLVIVLLQACIGNEKLTVVPKDGLKKSELTVSKDGKKIIDVQTTDCEVSGGYVVDVGGGLKSIALKATDIKTGVTILLSVYYNTLSDLAMNKTIPIGALEDLDLNNLPFCWGGVNFVNTGQQLFITKTGAISITSFDQATGIASCVFTFTAYDPAGQSADARFQGSFTNIPIYPDEDSFANCNTSTPGIDGGNPTNPSNPNPTSGNTELTFENKVFTPITITLGGVTQTIQPSQKGSFKGKGGSQTTYYAKTSGTTSSGTIVGSEIVWNNFAVTFPSSGTANVALNVASNWFFVRVRNNSIRNINKVLVNYQLQSGTIENLSIPNDKELYGLGYYRAFTNSNVRFENTDVNWYWQFGSDQLNLPFTVNQLVTLNAN